MLGIVGVVADATRNGVFPDWNSEPAADTSESSHSPHAATTPTSSISRIAAWEMTVISL